MIFIITSMVLYHLSVLINNSFNILQQTSGLNMLNINLGHKTQSNDKLW